MPLAAHTGAKVLAIDFQAAPKGTIDTMAEEVAKVVEALLASGQDPMRTGFLADSSGAIVLTQALNRLIKKGRRFWGAVYLSPWADITCLGDSFTTLSDFDPILRVKDYLEVAATLAAGSKVGDATLSMIRGTYPPGFPPSLIQVGSREIFLNQAALTYQRMREFGVDAEWELYDGMWHVFQATHPKLPTSLTAWARVSEFFSA